MSEHRWFRGRDTGTIYFALMGRYIVIAGAGVFTGKEGLSLAPSQVRRGAGIETIPNPIVVPQIRKSPMHTLHEPKVPQEVVDAFEKHYTKTLSLDLQRYDLEKNWGNTKRYHHEHIQSLWEGWRDAYINLIPRENLIPEPVPIINQQALILIDLLQKNNQVDIRVDHLIEAIKSIIALEPGGWKSMDSAPKDVVIFCTRPDDLTTSARPYKWVDASDYWNATDGSGACIRPAYMSEYVWTIVPRIWEEN